MPLAGDRAFLSHVAPADRRDLARDLRGLSPRWLHVCEVGTINNGSTLL